MNTKKTQTMICTPGRIRTQLPFESYRRMQRGRVTAAELNARPVECRQCGKVMLASSLGRHLADVHDIYQSQAISKGAAGGLTPGDLHCHTTESGQRAHMPVPVV